MSFARKSLGQHFLTSTEVRDDIVGLLEEAYRGRVLEIGPGLGFLTHALRKVCGDLTVVEVDGRAAERLRSELGHKDDFHLIEQDFLEVSLDDLFGDQPYVVVGNIPYNITSPILKKCLADTAHKPQVMILMVQKEVAEKICLDPWHPKKPKRSILSIAVEVYAEAEYAFTVGREHFLPPPKVQSAVMRLRLRLAPLVPPDLERDFFTVVRAGFSEKRKKLGNSLRKFFGVSVEGGPIDLDRRAETLGVGEWLALTEYLKKEGSVF